MVKKVLKKLKYRNPVTDKYGAPVTIGDAARLGKSRERWKRYKKWANMRMIDLWKPIDWVEPVPVPAPTPTPPEPPKPEHGSQA